MAYHRIGLTHRLGPYTWWRPVLELLLTTVIGSFLSLFFLLFTESLLHIAGYPVPDSGLYLDLDPSDPASKLQLYGALGAMLPAPFIAARIMGRRPRALWSVANRFRWKMFLLAIAVAVGFETALILFDALVAGSFIGPNPKPFDEHFFVGLLVVVVFIPLQATYEEVVFRGTVAQCVGSWVRSPWVAYLPGIPLFVIGHDYDIAGLTFVFIFAIICSFLVHLTGGLEVAIALHIVNNLTLEYAEAAGFAEMDFTERPSALFGSELTNYMLVGILLLVFRKHFPRKKYLKQLPAPAFAAQQLPPPAMQQQVPTQPQYAAQQYAPPAPQHYAPPQYSLQPPQVPPQQIPPQQVPPQQIPNPYGQHGNNPYGPWGYSGQ